MLDQFPAYGTEPEGYLMPINLKGAGAAVPTLLKGRVNYTLTRTSAGLLKISFNDDPGPTFMGLAGVGYADATATVVAGWTAVAGAYTAPSGTTKASLVVTTANSSFAAADMAATSSVTLLLAFKRAASDL